MHKIRICEDFVQDDSFKIKVTHSPILDITGAVFDLIFKEKETSTTAALAISQTAGDDADDDVANGIAYIPVTRENSSSLAAGTYFVTLKRTIGTDTLTIIRSGKDGVEKVRVHKTFIEKVV